MKYILQLFSSAHPWIKEDGEAPDKPLDNAVMGRLKQFRAMNKFKKVALRVLITPSNTSLCFKIKEIFYVLKLQKQSAKGV